MGCDPTGHWDWGGVVTGLGLVAIGTAAFMLTVTTAGAAAPLGALAISTAGTITSAATFITGFVVTTGAAVDGTVVSDFTFSVGVDRRGVSIVTDFKNDTCEIYTHYGYGSSDALGLSYSTGYVYDYNDLGDYAGDFAEGSISVGSISASYSQDPGKDANSGCRATCISFSSPSLFPMGYSEDYFIPVTYFMF